MKIISFEEFIEQQNYFIHEAKAWKIFVYPTDTVYGIWGIIDDLVIWKINKVKQRNHWKHYSIIAPSYERVEKIFLVVNFEEYRTTTKNSLKEWRWLTVLCPLKPEYTDTIWLVSSNNLVWIRFINHEFQNFVTQLWQGFISTSCNISWEKNIQDITEVTAEQSQNINFAIKVWSRKWLWSIIIDYVSWKIIRE